MAFKFTKASVKKLEKRYKEAVKKKEDVFTFDGHEFVTNYAKYLLQYLKMQDFK